MIMGLFGLLSRAKNYALQFVLGHRLVKARQPGLDAGTVATVSEFENLIDQLLGEVVDRHGKVNYERLAQPQGRQRLSNLAQFIAQHSPRSEPDSFPTQNDQLAFYMNAYNVLVLWGVVNNWPLKSVHDCRVWAIVKLAKVQPFFVGLHFEFAGYRKIGRGGLNLFDLEHKLIRKFGDPRIHAAINCASGGCPRLRQSAFRAATLDEELDACMLEMVTDPKHLRVDDSRRTITCSMIFKWYRGDFVGEGQAASIWDYWLRFLTPQHHQLLYMACQGRYEVEYEAYDWSINSQRLSQEQVSAATSHNTDGHFRSETGHLRRRQ